MARSRRPQRPPPVSSADRLRVSLTAVALIVLAGGLAAGPIAYQVSDRGKNDRLAVDGVPITATIENFQWHRRGPSTVDVVYDDQHRHRHRAEILCAGLSGCESGTPGPTLPIRVDADEPAEFVAATGETDDSTAFFNSWGWLLWSVILLALGGVVSFLRLMMSGRWRLRHDRVT